jgi:hypothetical protein
MDRIRGAAVAVELGGLGRHFLSRKSISPSGQSDPDRSGESGGYHAKQLTPSLESCLSRGRGPIGVNAGHEVLQQATAQYWKMRPYKVNRAAAQ